MKSLWVYVIFCSVIQIRATYSGNSELCRPWTCVERKLGIDGEKESTRDVLKKILPSGDWQNVIEDVVDVCHHASQPRRYTDTCPGQGVLHCIVDQLIHNCPTESERKNDACAPVSSLAGFKYMFSQSIYEDIDRNIRLENHPAEYMRHYFSSKCCNLPDIINTTVLTECRFDNFMKFYDHKPPTQHVRILPLESMTNYVTVLNAFKNIVNTEVDPLSCCDLSDFINTSDLDGCDFKLSWNATNRLVIKNNTRIEFTTTTTTTTPRPTTESSARRNVVKIVPLSCEKETCVFRNLNIVSESGTVDTHAFSKLLDNFTRDYPEWVKAKARVVTKCLSRPIRGYDADCEINKVLACTFDVLTENCPHGKKGVDPCKHTHATLNDTICQISTSKYGPKHRRRYCDLPRLVNFATVQSCGESDIGKMVIVPDVVAPTQSKFLKPQYMMSKWLTYKPTCKESTASALCLMDKMGVLSKYKFLDHFKLKDKIRQFTASKAEWQSMRDAYLNAMVGIPYYRDHCTSQKKLLNVIDAMIATCPASKRRSTEQCNDFYNKLTNPFRIPSPEEKRKQLQEHFQHMYLPHNSQSSTFRPAFGDGMVTNSNLRLRSNLRGARNDKLAWGIFRPKTSELQLRYPGEFGVANYSRDYPMTTVFLPVYRRLQSPKYHLPMLRSGLLPARLYGGLGDSLLTHSEPRSNTSPLYQ